MALPAILVAGKEVSNLTRKEGEMATPEQELMDAAAKEAKAELTEKIDGWSVKDLIDWWGRWYLKAGYKRLGRELVEWDRHFKSGKD